jgi:hypothetical protein
MGYIRQLTMTVALRQPVAQATLPRSRACQRECQSWYGCNWRETAGNSAISNSAAAGRLGRGARAVRRVATGLRGQRLTFQLLANRVHRNQHSAAARGSGRGAQSAGWSALGAR